MANVERDAGAVRQGQEREAAFVRRLGRRVANEPDWRDDVVRGLAARVAAGTYRIGASSLAERLAPRLMVSRRDAPFGFGEIGAQ